MTWCLINAPPKQFCMYSLEGCSGSDRGQLSDDNKGCMLKACKNLESRAMGFFVANGWSFTFVLVFSGVLVIS